MREIKFRAWDKEEKNFMYFNATNGLLSECDEVYAKRNIRGIDQFTGLKDKHGKEIYEGDLFDFGGFGVIEVCNGWYDNGGEYEDADFGLGWYLLGHLEDCLYCHGIAHLDIEVAKGRFNKKIIGNKFENPELLGSLNDI